MNKRTLELYRQAQVPHTAIDPSNNMPYETTTFSAEKFAELIVRECASMARVYHSHEYDFTGDLELDEFMLKHFGVEE